MYINSGMADFTVKLTDIEAQIYAHILERWPTSALEVAEHFREDLSTREQRRKISTKYAYYLQKLISKQLLLSKRVGNALVVWPLRVERYRTIHSILEER